jgi:hypothetical protein
MASQLPLDFSHPTVVTPLSTLVSVATVGARDRIHRSPFFERHRRNMARPHLS